MGYMFLLYRVIFRPSKTTDLIFYKVVKYTVGPPMLT